MKSHREPNEQFERAARIARSQRQAIDLFLIEISRIERAAMAAVAARTQQQLGTAFEPDPDEGAVAAGGCGHTAEKRA